MDATRRGLIAGGAAALLLAPRPAAAKNVGDAAVLARILVAEQALAYLYKAAPAGGLFGPDVAAALARLADHEAEHAGAVDTQLEAMGGTKPTAPKTHQELDARLEQLGIHQRLTGRADANAILAVALALEEKAVALYSDAVSELEDLRLIQTCASIMASDGQHLVALRNLLRIDPIPRAVEAGS